MTNIPNLIEALHNEAADWKVGPCVLEAAVELERMHAEMERLREALGVGEAFLNKCFSAWSCGEPEHRVRTMLDYADKFRAALDELERT